MKDIRDLRDPQLLGDTLLKEAAKVRSAYGKDIPLSEIYDVHVSHFPIPNTPDGTLSGAVAVEAYQKELNERAQKGDKFAKAVLDGNSSRSEAVLEKESWDAGD